MAVALFRYFVNLVAIALSGAMAALCRLVALKFGLSFQTEGDYW